MSARLRLSLAATLAVAAQACLEPATTPVEQATETHELTLAPGETSERVLAYEGARDVTFRTVVESATPLDDVLDVELVHAPRGKGASARDREARCTREESSRSDATGLAQREIVSSCGSRTGRVRVRLTNVAGASVTFGWRVVASMELEDGADDGALRLDDDARND